MKNLIARLFQRDPKLLVAFHNLVHAGINQTRFSAVWGRLVVIGVFIATGALFAGTSDSFDFRWFAERSGELRIIMTTSTVESSFLDHSLKVRSLRGWLVCFDIGAEGPVEKRARVYGPLWAVVGKQSWLNAVDGIAFTDEDRRANEQRGFVAFDHQSDVIRIRDSRRDRLKIDIDSGTWTYDGPFKWDVAPVPPGSEDEIQTLSHRYRLHRDKNTTAKVYETLTGRQVADNWLESAFETYRTMDEMGNISAHVTNELDYLVCFPAPIWNRFGEPNAPRQIVDTFEWKGQTCPRDKWAFYFKRGEPAPILVQKPVVPGVFLFGGAPSQALSIEGRLWLLYLTDSGATLICMETGETRQFRPSDKLPNGTLGLGLTHSRIQHNPDQDEIVFFADDIAAENAAVYIWNYETGVIRFEAFPVKDLFHRSKGQLTARTARPVGESK